MSLPRHRLPSKHALTLSSLPPSLPPLLTSPGVQVRQAAVGYPPSCPEEARGDQGLLRQAPCSSGGPLNLQQQQRRQQQQDTHRHHRLSASAFGWMDRNGRRRCVYLYCPFVAQAGREGGREGGVAWRRVCKKEGSWALLRRGEEGEKKQRRTGHNT